MSRGGLVAYYLKHWSLRRDGTPRRGQAALVLPVRRVDGTPAVLKVQPVDEETTGEPAALRAWSGHGAVLLMEHDADTGAMLLERLDAERTLSSVPDDSHALRILCELLDRLATAPAPPGLRRLQNITERMLARVPNCFAHLTAPEDRRLVRTFAAMVADLLPVREARLLHWDLHYDNVLAGSREPWLAIDPKPLAGELGFEMLPALWNRWTDLTSGGSVERAVRRRFDLMVEMLDLDRRRAVAWTMGRLLQNVLWDVDGGRHAIDPRLVTIAGALLPRTV